MTQAEKPGDFPLGPPRPKTPYFSTPHEPVLYVWELIDALEHLPFDAIVKVRVKDSQTAEHFSKDSDRKRVLHGPAKQVFMFSEHGAVIIDAWPKAPEHQGSDDDVSRHRA